MFLAPAPITRYYAPRLATPAPNFRSAAPNNFTTVPINRYYAPTIGAAVATTGIIVQHIRTPQFTTPAPPITLIIYSLTIKNTHYENLC